MVQEYKNNEVSFRLCASVDGCGDENSCCSPGGYIGEKVPALLASPGSFGLK